LSSTASVTLRTPDGVEHELVHGEIIGRVWSAALQIDDGRVSEAHALVSLRGSALKLLALRGLFALDGKPLKELDLCAGQTIELARGLALDVVDVRLPGEIWEISSEEIGRVPLVGVCSVSRTPQLRIRPGARQNADAVFYLGADGWRVRIGEEALPLHDGMTLDLTAYTITVHRRVLGGEGTQTRVAGSVDAPIRLTTRYDSITLERDGYPALRLTGVSARMISELAAVGTALHWESLSRELWPGNIDVLPLRKRFDAALSRLRRKLTDAGVRADLVRSDHSGLFELVLHDHDVLVDES